MSLPQVQLRLGAASDLDAILNLERETTNAPHWPRTTYADLLATSYGRGADPQQTGVWRRCLFVAVAQGGARESLLGFAVGLMHPVPAAHDLSLPDSFGREEVSAELESVAVAVSARRAGIGLALCRAVIGWAESLGATEAVLEVRATSAAAIALYAGLGFTQIGRRTGYYQNPGDDALVMRLSPVGKTGLGR